VKGHRKFVVVGILTFCSIAGWAGKKPQSAEMQTFSGEITDTLCAANGSHQKMMQQMKSMGNDKATCVKQCLLVGAKYALYDDASHSFYRIDDQAKDKVAPFAGQHVRVTGTLDKKTIKVSDIKAE
jgi:hypothetical protein